MSPFPVAYAVCLASIFAMFFLEQLASSYFHNILAQQKQHDDESETVKNQSQSSPAPHSDSQASTEMVPVDTTIAAATVSTSARSPDHGSEIEPHHHHDLIALGHMNVRPLLGSWYTYNAYLMIFIVLLCTFYYLL